MIDKILEKIEKGAFDIKCININNDYTFKINIQERVLDCKLACHPHVEFYENDFLLSARLNLFVDSTLMLGTTIRTIDNDLKSVRLAFVKILNILRERKAIEAKQKRNEVMSLFEKS